VSEVPPKSGSVLRREHLVAACLVGTVVVVVGFASGLGLRHPTSTATEAAPQPSGAPRNPAVALTPQGGSAAGGSSGAAGSAPVNYVGTPTGGGLGTPPLLGPFPAGPTVVATPTAGTPTTTTSVTSPPSPSCQPGLLNTVLNQVTTVVNGVPVVGSLLGGLTGGGSPGATPVPQAPSGLVNGLTGQLLGNCPATDTPTPTPTPSGPGS